MQRMRAERQLDMDITETSNITPVAIRHYPVAQQHMPELEHQIKALLDAGTVCESVSLYTSPRVCVSTIGILTGKPCVTVTPPQSPRTSSHELEVRTCSLVWTCNPDSTNFAYAKEINTKLRSPLWVANMNE